MNVGEERSVERWTVKSSVATDSKITNEYCNEYAQYERTNILLFYPYRRAHIQHTMYASLLFEPERTKT